MHPEIVRDGPGACPICGMALEPRDDHRRRGAQPGARRHDAPVLGQRRARRSPLVVLAMGEHGARACARPAGRRARVGRAGARVAGRAVGRLAVLRALPGFARQPQPEHVHADRARCRRRVRLQPGRGARAGDLPGRVPWPRRRRGRLLRAGRGDRDAGAARAGAGAARARPDRRRDPRLAEPVAQARAARSRRRRRRRRGARRRSSWRSAARPSGRQRSCRRRRRGR